MPDPRVHVQGSARGWTKAEYDAAPEMADRLHRRILDLQDTVAQTGTALLVYGQHLPICGTFTAAGCDCGWAEWQRHLEVQS